MTPINIACQVGLAAAMIGLVFVVRRNRVGREVAWLDALVVPLDRAAYDTDPITRIVVR